MVFGALQELGELLLVKPQTKMSGKQKKTYEKKKGALGHWLLDSLLNLGRNGLMILEFMHLSIHITTLAS